MDTLAANHERGTCTERWALTDEAYHLGGAIASIKAAHLWAGLPKNGIVSSNLHSRQMGQSAVLPMAAGRPEIVKRRFVSAGRPYDTDGCVIACRGWCTAAARHNAALCNRLLSALVESTAERFEAGHEQGWCPAAVKLSAAGDSAGLTVMSATMCRMCPPPTA